MDEVAPGIWWWQAPHPDWTPEADWPQLVTAYAIDTGERVLLVDPIAVPAGLARETAGKRTEILLTCPWHRRDAAHLGHAVHVPPPDAKDPDPVQGEVYRAGDELAIGARAIPGMEPNDLVLWIEARGAVVLGDTLIDRGGGLEVPLDWAQRLGTDVEQLKRDLLPLLDLPVEHVLPTHGAPTDRAALERALS